MAYSVPQPWIAAANPDIQVLRGLIDDATAGRHSIHQETRIRRLNEPAITEYGEWVSTPLLRAIKHNHVEHVRTMLEAGVDPNGVSIRDMLRFTVRMFAEDDVSSDMLAEMDEREMLNRLQSSQKQKKAIINGEILREREAGRTCPFWGHPGSQDQTPCGKYDILPELDVDAYGNIPMPSLTVAAWYGSTQIIDLLLAYWPDTTSWTYDDKDMPLATKFTATCSALSLVTPLHAAVRCGHAETVRHLLQRGFNPNATRSFALDGATTALQYSIITRWQTGSSAFKILARDARSNFSLLTPYLQVSSLHLAVATLDIELVERTMNDGTSIDFSANVTALKQTVLHVACLPSTDADLKFYVSPAGPAVQESIHHCRGNTAMTEDGRILSSQEQHSLQSEIVKFLLERHQGSTAMLIQQDVFGNTPLHYLAAAHQPNVELLAYLKRYSGEALEAWNQSVNEKGYSPKALYGANGE